MSNRDDPQEVRLDLVDDAVRKAAKWKTTCAPSPDIADKWVFQQSGNRPLKLSGERFTKLSVCVFDVERGGLLQFG